MAKREKKVVQTGITQEEMEIAFGEYAKADARLDKINAEIDLQVTKIRDKYALEIAELTKAKEEKFDVIQTYSSENPDIFGKKKSAENVHGTFGFRTGTPKLKLIKKFTWGAVTEMLKELLPKYVRTTEEPAKDKLLADRNNEEVAKNLSRVGLSVVQDESFFIELKKETA